MFFVCSIVPGLEAGDGTWRFLGRFLQDVIGIDIGDADLIFLPQRQQEKGGGGNERGAEDKQVGGKGQ